jgi:CRISPR-associated protein Cas2
MVVVVANYIPPAVRGRMKLWFIEPKLNVFVSGINDSNADDVIDYLYDKCPIESGLMIFQRIKNVPGYKIRGIGEQKRTLIEINGLQLIQENEKLNNDLLDMKGFHNDQQ